LRDFLDAVRTPLPPPQPYYAPQPPPYYQPNPIQPFQQPYNPYGRVPISPDTLQQTCTLMQQINLLGRSVSPRNITFEERRAADYSLASTGWTWGALWWEAKRSGIYPCTALW
jgi:hypothetical protein